MESPTIRWFVIVEEDVTAQLAGVLREGTQVVLVRRVSSIKAQLFSSRVDPDGNIRFHQGGWWSEESWRDNTLHELKTTLVPNLGQLYSNFQARQLLVSTNDNWPFFKINTLDNGTVIPIAGIDLQVITTISEALNFTSVQYNRCHY
ncbi:hypothetical protein OTU49_002519 [Cherax quadricarinatus]|uniref:Uncharacterized protein n=1 Tax=Cherax quadricarinatus TaxID=27406 RepID=A0AAW0XPC5_CHEQU